MASTFLEFMLRDMKRDVKRGVTRKIGDYAIGMIPKPVRKIVGWILVIFGAVALLILYPGTLFYTMSELMFMITFFVGIVSFGLGISLLRHKG